MSTVLTIGHTKTSLEGFISRLQDSRVDAVIDIRLRNTSQLAGFAKRDDLAFILQEGFGIAYHHYPELAPTGEIFDAYRQDCNWPAYEREFRLLLAERDAADIGRELLGRYQRPCLLCSEPTADRCHRGLVVEWWAEHLGDLEVIHL
ncbi:MAG: DUF488 family protein [Anaerolineae bacterium]|nr:DUF488 family protein [Anaerolineae bacterium]